LNLKEEYEKKRGKRRRITGRIVGDGEIIRTLAPPKYRVHRIK
jgi:hypothetical protein